MTLHFLLVLYICRSGKRVRNGMAALEVKETSVRAVRPVWEESPGPGAARRLRCRERARSCVRNVNFESIIEIILSTSTTPNNASCSSPSPSHSSSPLLRTDNKAQQSRSLFRSTSRDPRTPGSPLPILSISSLPAPLAKRRPPQILVGRPPGVAHGFPLRLSRLVKASQNL